MPSTAYQSLLQRLAEIDTLLATDPTPPGRMPPNLTLTSALNRACTVMLCSHLQGYVEDLAGEISAVLAQSAVKGPFPGLADAHLIGHVKRIANEENRSLRRTLVQDLVDQHAPAWASGQPLQSSLVDLTLVTDDMGNPRPNVLERLLAAFGMNGVFVGIAPKNHRFLRDTVTEIVDKRNDIAHGNLLASVARSDVLRYRKTIRDVCERLDKLAARHVKATAHIPRPW